MKTALLLAGTAEARAFAEDFGHPAVRLVASLAGATAKPVAYACPVRVGGFGGAEGLCRWMAREGVVAVVDATHPFATTISVNARAACKEARVPLLALLRPAWEAVGDWHGFASLGDAVKALPSGARVLATTGRKDSATLSRRTDIDVVLRSVDEPGDLPAHVEAITARGPFTVDSEIALIHTRGITHLLTRNAGGESRARLDAAAALGIPIYVIERPPESGANSVSNVADALEWLSTVLRD